MVLKWLRAIALSAVLALPAPGAVPGVAAAPGTVAALAAGAVVLLTPGSAEAQRRSGGFARPGRTPSFGAPRAPTRTPSTSGGYARPRTAPGTGAAPFGAPTPGDRAVSRRYSGEALDQFRARQQPPATTPTPGTAPRTAPGTTPDAWYGGSRRYGGGTPWYGTRNWRPPAYVQRAPRSFGIWDGLFLWFLLDSLNQPGHAAFFHNHRDDAGYAQWRAEAERLAAEDPELRTKLDGLDQRLAEQAEQPRNPNYLPPGITPTEALAAEAQTSGETGWLVTSLLVGGGVAVFFLYWQRQSRGPARRSPGGDKTVDKLRSAADIVRHRMSGERYTPSLFRVGMTFTLDPTPFILAAGSTKVELPDIAGSNQLVSVEAVGTVNTGSATLYRLYLPESRSFFQIHLNAAGQPDECRFFSFMDEVNPASADEWGLWLEPQEGMIGWPEFQTRDDKIYARAWAPGQSWIPPRALHETIAEPDRMVIRQSKAMLYGAPTGLAAPAPQTEYILVAAVEESGQAWVEVHAGIDVNPATLSLS